MSVSPKLLFPCFVFAILINIAQAQPPAPMPEEYLEDDASIGMAALEQDNTGWVDDPPLTLMPRWMGMPWMYHGPQAGVETPHFRDTELGDRPHYGENGSPGMGYPHREGPPALYDIWYRPNGYEGQSNWYQPYSFNPRGYGIPQHRTAYKLDYAPAVLSTTATQYGPYYYPRYHDLHDPQTGDCDEGDSCYSKTCRKRSFWLLKR